MGLSAFLKRPAKPLNAASPASPAFALAGFVAGVAGQLQQPSLWPLHVYIALLGLAAVLAGSALWMRRATALSHGKMFVLTRLLTVLAAALLGLSLTGWRASAFQAGVLDPSLEMRDVTVTGRVVAMPQRSQDAVRFRLAIESAQIGAEAVTFPPQVLLGWYSNFSARATNPSVDMDSEAGELAQLRLPQPMRAGERWQMTVRLKAPHGDSNPHGFDYELWLWEQGIQATGYVRAGLSDAPPRRLTGDWGETLYGVERARQSVRESIYERVADRQRAGVLAALVVGDQSAIERADWDVFRATGVAHLMSISGLHITMFAWLAAWLLTRLWRRSVRLTPRWCLAMPASSAGALGGLVLAVLYAVFSGWGVPAQRTICMLATVILLRQTGRHWPWFSTWLLAMAVVVALDPWALMQAGFWLSFVAVGVLFATDSGVRSTDQASTDDAGGGRLSGLLASVGRAAREQWVVTLALTPLSLLLFHQVSVVGLLANAVAIPWVTLLVTPLAMLGVLVPPVWDAAAWAVAGLTWFLQWLASWPLATVSVAAAPLWCAVAGVLGGGLLALRLPWSWRLLGVPLLLPVLLWQPARVPPGQFELLAADVGQGNAVLVRTATHTLLYDTGPRFSSGDNDAGKRVLVPLLRAMGERLDLLMLSHRDSDHTGGAPAVLAMQPQAGLISSIEDGHELQTLRKSTRCVAGQRWAWDGVTFEVLHPSAADYSVANKPNAMSCVLRISNGQQIALLAGDIEAAQEQRLVAQTPDLLKADVLLVPHHGSKTSSSAAFLDAVQPRLALVQAGYRNRFSHPVESVLQRYEARGIRVVKSPRCGAALWQSSEPAGVLCQRQQEPHYWQHQMASEAGEG